MTILRLYGRRDESRLEDLQHGIDLSEYGGICPSVSDHILASVRAETGTLWEVRARFFKTNGHDNYVVHAFDKQEAHPGESIRSEATK